MKKVLSCICLYDEVQKYEISAINYIMEQTYISDVLIIDDYTKYEVRKYKNAFLYKNKSMNPYEIREFCFKFAIKNNYDYIVFFDSDDIYKKNRIEKLLHKIEKNESDICVHNMEIVNYNEKTIIREFLSKDIDYLSNIKQNILKYNFIGLGNSIFKVDKLKDIPKCPSNVIFDWWIAIHLIIQNNAKCCIEFTPLSKYRQYEENTANIISINEKIIYKEYLCKLNLYINLLNDLRFNNEKINIVNQIKHITDNYLNKKINMQKQFHCWWNYLNEEE